MIQKSDKRYKIQVIVNGSPLTFNNCLIISEDATWLEFSDKFDVILKYNKNTVVSMELIK